MSESAKSCAACGKTGKANFSNSQWKAKDASKRRCKACVDGGKEVSATAPKAAAAASKEAPAGAAKKGEKEFQFNFAAPKADKKEAAKPATAGFNFNFAPKEGAEKKEPAKQFNFGGAKPKKQMWKDDKGGAISSAIGDEQQADLELDLAAAEVQDNSLQGVLQNNPDVLAAIQAQLDNLMGMQSGFIEKLPPAVKRRIQALKKLQEKYRETEIQWERELRELEIKYEKLYAPLYEKRRQIVVGEHEPTDAELLISEDDDGQDVDEEDDTEYVGIPAFWRNALQTAPLFQEIITEKDEAALAHCLDIRAEFLTDNKGFQITFTFEENEFFTNKTLTKAYYFQEHEVDNLVFDHAEGSTINWKAGKNFTIKQKKRSGRGMAVEEVQCFFTFFSPPDIPDDATLEAMSEDERQELILMSELDYEMGEEIRGKIIPRAVLWFTGEAAAGDDFDRDNSDDDDDDEDYSEDGDGDYNPVGEKPAECQQQ